VSTIAMVAVVTVFTTASIIPDPSKAETDIDSDVMDKETLELLISK
jgi:hypothetical protein